MRLRVAYVLFAVVAFAATAAPSGENTEDNPSPPPASQGGPTEVQYASTDSGVLTSAWSVPGGSAFRFGNGSDGAPCQFPYFPAAGDDPDDGIDSSGGSVLVDGRWRFTETTDVVVDWTVENVLLFESMSPDGSVTEVVRGYGAVAEGFRRFDVYCVGHHGNGAPAGVRLEVGRLVSVTDEFFGIEDRVAELRNQIVLDRPGVATVPEVGVFGGLPVNMPASLQIDALPWRVYSAASPEYRGFVSRLVAEPSRLEFVVAFVPDEGVVVVETVGCLSGFSVQPDVGNIPVRDPQVPDFAEPGYTASCVWVPPEPGEVTVRAVMTYDVTLVISGVSGPYQREEEPFVWESDPVTLRVDELRAVNTRPGGNQP